MGLALATQRRKNSLDLETGGSFPRKTPLRGRKEGGGEGGCRSRWRAGVVGQRTRIIKAVRSNIRGVRHRGGEGLLLLAGKRRMGKFAGAKTRRLPAA